MSVTVALLAFMAAAAVLIVTPGPDTILVLRTTAVEGPRRGACTSAGICLGLMCWGLGVALGVGVLLAASHLAYTVLRVLGAAYLAWLGLTLILRPHRSADAAPGAAGGDANGPDSRPARRRPTDRASTAWFARGLLSNLTNPKVGVFYVTFFPQFVPAGVTVAPFIALLVAIHLAETVIWLAFLIVAAQSAARLLLRPRIARVLDRITGFVLVGAGLRLAAEGRR